MNVGDIQVTKWYHLGNVICRVVGVTQNMALGDHYQFIDRQTYNTVVPVYNVYWFEQVLGTGTASDLISAWLFYYLPAIVGIQTAVVTHLEVAAINVDNVADYASYAVTTGNVGTLGSHGLPPFVCWTFRLNRTERGHHNGYKRICGVDEGWQEEGIEENLTSALQTVAGIMGAQLNPGNGNKWNPMIHRAANTIKPTYNNPEAFFNVGTCAYVGITSQNSRKY